MRARLYDFSSLALIAISIYFFYRSVLFLGGNDYVGAVVAMLIGLVVIRVGVELSRIALVAAGQAAAAAPGEVETTRR